MTDTFHILNIFSKHTVLAYSFKNASRFLCIFCVNFERSQVLKIVNTDLYFNTVSFITTDHLSTKQYTFELMNKQGKVELQTEYSIST